MSSSLVAITLAVLAASDAPVSEVTVFSDRAQVVRTTRASVAGTTTLELGPFFERIDASSLRVDVEGAELRRVDLVPTRVDGFSTAEARTVAERLETLGAEVVRNRGEQAAYRSQLSQLQRLEPTFPPETGQRPAPRLSPAGWEAALRFAAEREEVLQARVRELAARGEKLDAQYAELRERATLLGNAERRQGTSVRVVLAGTGTAGVRLTYLVPGARWLPAYELRLLPERSEVEVQLSGQVTQQTGADWEDVALTLSTALPDRPAQLPKLLTWKIGARDRFIPTPEPVANPIAPPPPRPPPVELARPSDAELLRGRLLAARERELPEAEDLEVVEGEVEGGVVGGVVGGVAGGTVASPSEEAPSAAPPPPPRTADARERRAPSRQRRTGAPSAAPSMAQAPGMAAAEPDVAEREAEDATASLALAAPPSYRPPPLPANSAASQADGRELAFKALRTESLRSGAEERRVALRVERWPVSVERRLFPALFPEAYLVAELKSPSKETLPRGEARLFVGDDPSGVATMPLTSPGETFTLPLGVDHAVRPVRNVQLVTGQSGFIGKKDVNTYEVTVELTNPYPTPIALRVFDQVPLSNHQDVEVELLSTTPAASHDKATGALEWRLTLEASKKTTLSFRYALKKPKDTRFTQEAQ